jgi:hypothetical protein
MGLRHATKLMHGCATLQSWCMAAPRYKAGAWLRHATKLVHGCATLTKLVHGCATLQYK